MTLTVRDLRLERKGRTLLRDITLDFPDAHSTAILGISGSGSSEFLEVLAGLTPATSGSILLDGKELVGMDDDERAHLRRHHIGCIFTRGNLLTSHTVKQNIDMPLHLSKKKSEEDFARHVYETLGITDILEENPSDIAPVEHKRVAIARCLISGASTILADNPCDDLARAEAHHIRELLRMCAREFGRTVITLTNNFADAIAAERILLFGDGQVDTTVNDPSLLALFSVLEAQNE